LYGCVILNLTDFFTFSFISTRVVQKLIESLRTRQQISLAVSALEPGFLALIKDLNGNHVVQRCLLCLSNEDNRARFLSFSLKYYILDNNIVLLSVNRNVYTYLTLCFCFINILVGDNWSYSFHSESFSSLTCNPF